MKEGYGNDNFAIAWEYPGKALEVIPASFSHAVFSCTYDVANCGATLDTWTGISGTSIADLISSTDNFARVPNTSTKIHYLWNSLQGPTNIGDNYGSRMKGWLLPPRGDWYTFYIAADDTGELWLSTDHKDPTEKERI